MYGCGYLGEEVRSSEEEGWKDGRMGEWGSGDMDIKMVNIGYLVQSSINMSEKKKKKRYKNFQIHNTTQHNR